MRSVASVGSTLIETECLDAESTLRSDRFRVFKLCIEDQPNDYVGFQPSGTRARSIFDRSQMASAMPEKSIFP